MADEENVGGNAEGINEGFEGRMDAGGAREGQASAQAQGSEGYEGASGEQSAEPGGGEQQSNLGDWDPSRQGGGGGEVY
jgi:hypothetical protein